MGYRPQLLQVAVAFICFALLFTYACGVRDLAFYDAEFFWFLLDFGSAGGIYISKRVELVYLLGVVLGAEF